MLRFEPAVDIYIYIPTNLELNTTPSHAANTVSLETKHHRVLVSNPAICPPGRHGVNQIGRQ